VNLQWEAAWELHQFLTGRGIPYAIIGGIAVQFWGEPRLTRDVDLTIAAPLDEPDRWCAPWLNSLVRDALIRWNSPVLPEWVLIHASNGCRRYLTGAAWLRRQRDATHHDYEIESGKVVALCSAKI